MIRRPLFRFDVTVALLVLGMGCVAAGDGVAAPPPPPVARTYSTACAPCHDNGGVAVKILTDRLGAKAALIDRRNTLDADTIRFVVRHGMGAMPAMSKLEVSDAALDGIIAYLAKARTRDVTP